MLFRSDWEACSILGTRYATGVGTDQDPNEAERYLKAACAGGSAWGCSNLGTFYQRSQPSGSAEEVAAFDKACSLGNANGCHRAGEARLNGRGTDVNRAAAFKDFEKACFSNDEGSTGVRSAFVSCDRVGNMLLRGEVTAKDPKRRRSPFGEPAMPV